MCNWWQKALCPAPGCVVKDYGNLTFEDVPNDEPIGRLKTPGAVGRANEQLAGAVQKIKSDGNTCVMLGGDHRSLCTSSSLQFNVWTYSQHFVCCFLQLGDWFDLWSCCLKTWAECFMGGCTCRHQHTFNYTNGKHSRPTAVISHPWTALKGKRSWWSLIISAPLLKFV